MSSSLVRDALGLSPCMFDGRFFSASFFEANQAQDSGMRALKARGNCPERLPYSCFDYLPSDSCRKSFASHFDFDGGQMIEVPMNQSCLCIAEKVDVNNG